MLSFRLLCGVVALGCGSAQVARGQSAPAASTSADSVLTLSDAIRLADANFPLLRARDEDARAAHEVLVRTKETYLPSVDLGGQISRATDNNLTGLSFSQSVIQPITGIVRADNENNLIYGSAVGASVTWTPFTFGRREAEVRAAHGELTRASGVAAGQRFQHQLDVGASYMTALAAEALVRVQQGNVDRASEVVRSVEALARSGLRAGADSLLAEADASHARLTLFAAQRDVTAARRLLAEAIGGSPGQRALTAGLEGQRLLDQLPDSMVPATPSFDAHPLAAPFHARVDADAAQRTAIARSLFPTVSLLGAAFGRGSGANANGQFDPSLSGIDLTRFNYAVGVSVGLPLWNLFSAGPRIGEAAAHERSAAAEYDGELQHLASQRDVAAADFALALREAAETPVQRAAAAGAAQQMNVRYGAGLATLADVAQAQLALTRAETDDVLARLGAWRARLALAGANGDLTPFLALVR
ncbi:MAG TPA: TolC family protein [Gemmatimonadaceae bacterium]|nr:TolC family protein [Gemmatimonadaceae bacterium]